MVNPSFITGFAAGVCCSIIGTSLVVTIIIYLSGMKNKSCKYCSTSYPVHDDGCPVGQIDIMCDSLNFYSKKDNYTDPYGITAIEQDGGNRAREALKRAKVFQEK